jgi:hypothetical protein
MQQRRNNHDVTDRVDLTNPTEVYEAVGGILADRYPGLDLAPLRDAFETFARLYAGVLPGYHGCDTWYHDAQHSFDCTLAMARLLDGRDRDLPEWERLGPRRAMFGTICALFHDSGYIRRWSEAHFHNGAEFTLYHVSRSGDFLAEYLPTVDFSREAELARRIVHYTGYEVALDKIPVRDPMDRQLGFLLGTADLLAQMADRCYPEKCHRFLYHEFEACGVAGPLIAGVRKPIYDSADDLIRKTPGFAQKLFGERLDGYFRGAHACMNAHFGGDDPYLDQIRQHLAYIETLVAADDLARLRRRPRSINGHRFRQLLGLKLARHHPRHTQIIRARPHAHARHVPGRRRLAHYMPV